MCRRFTILEILVSLVVLSIGVLGILALIPASVASAERTTNSRLATELGAAVLNELRLAAQAPEVEWLPGSAESPARPRVVKLLLRQQNTDPLAITLPYGNDHLLVFPEDRGQALSTFPVVDPGGNSKNGAVAEGQTLPPPRFSFRLKVARSYVNGERVNGLYDVAVLVYQGLEVAADAQPEAILTTQIMAGPLDLLTLGRP